MDLDTQIDPSPLIARKFSSRLSSIGVEDHDIEQSSLTLTDFQRTSSDVHISANSSGSLWRERILHPCASTKLYFSDLSSVFTWRFLSWLAIQNFAMYGGVSALIMSVSLPLFKEMGIDASRQQLYSTMTLSPFALKPFIGVFLRLVPHKRLSQEISCININTHRFDWMFGITCIISQQKCKSSRTRPSNSVQTIGLACHMLLLYERNSSQFRYLGRG